MAVKGEDCFSHIEPSEGEKAPTFQQLTTLAFLGFKYSQTRFNSLEQIGGYLKANFFPNYQINEETATALTARVQQIVYKYLQPVIELREGMNSSHHAPILNGESTREERYAKFEMSFNYAMGCFIDGMNGEPIASVDLLTRQTIGEDSNFFYKREREPFLFAHGFHGKPTGASEYDAMFGDMRKFTVDKIENGEWRFETFPHLFLLARDYQQAFPDRTLDFPQPVGPTSFAVPTPDGLRIVKL